MVTLLSLEALSRYLFSPQSVPQDQRPNAWLATVIAGVALAGSVALYVVILKKLFPRPEGQLSAKRDFGVDGVGAVVAILIWFGCMVWGVLISPHLHLLVFDREMVSPSQEQMLLTQVMTLLSAPIFIVVAGRMNPRSKTGLEPKHALPTIWKAFPPFIGWLAMAITVGIFGTALTEALGGDYAAKQEVLEVALRETNIKYVYGIFAIIIAAPVIEETIFRGGVFAAMRGGMNFWFAALGSSLIFLVIHDPVKTPAMAAGIFLLGFLLAYTYERTGSIWYGVVIHGLHNGLTLSAHWFDWVDLP